MKLSLLTLCFFAAIHACAQPGFFNVREAPFSAAGDGRTDDTKSLQAALNAAEKNGGGVVIVPPGDYLIGTLELPNRVYLRGLGGTTFGPGKTEITRGADVFMAQPSTVLRLMNNAPGHMIIPRGGPARYTFYQAGVENLVLYGNKENQSGTVDGIHITDAVHPDGTPDPNRSQALLRNLLIYSFSGNGFYGGKFQHELFIDNVWTYGCGKNGFEFRGEDLKVHFSGAGDNGNAGFLISGSGTGRYFDIDAWGNNTGVEIVDVLSLTFFRLQANHNKGHGLWIHRGDQSTGFAPGRIQIFGGTFGTNSQGVNGVYSDVMLSSSSYGPYDILFQGCEFRGGNKKVKPAFALSNDSKVPRRILVDASLFIESGYDSGLVSNPDLFRLRDCTSYDSGASMFGQVALPYNDIQYSDYQMTTPDGFVRVKTGNSDRTISLPRLSSVQLGEVFYVSKADDPPASVILVAQSDDRLEGETSIEAQFETLMIIRTPQSWYSVSFGSKR